MRHKAHCLCLQATDGKGGSRAVYVAPKEELAKERFADWNAKFGPQGLGLNVCLLTGDPLADYGMLKEANIVITIPEYWDMLSRRWRQPSRKEVRNVALFLVDELHLIGGANGPVLEVRHICRLAESLCTSLGVHRLCTAAAWPWLQATHPHVAVCQFCAAGLYITKNPALIRPS